MMNDHRRRAWRRRLGLGLVSVVLCAGIVHAELSSAALRAPRTVSTRDWLSLRLQVLGLGLSYPAYRVSIELQQDRIAFEFWISTPMSEHLTDAGREETERILTYHARGIQRRVAAVLERDAPELLGAYDGRDDLVGEFLVPGSELEAPPQRWAVWRDGALEWDYRE